MTLVSGIDTWTEHAAIWALGVGVSSLPACPNKAHHSYKRRLRTNRASEIMESEDLCFPKQDTET